MRHGRTLGNVQRVLVGSTDIPLDSLGVQQAELVGRRLADAIEADVLLSSPLQRAYVTARAIGDKMNLSPVLRPRLAEWNFGDAEGLSMEVLAGQYPDIAARFADIDDFDVGWPGGETRRTFHDRVYIEFTDILRSYERHTLIVVAHGGVFGSLLAQIQGKSPNDWTQYAIHNCSVTHLEVTVEETAIHLLNDIEHLNGLTDSLEGLQTE
ncbi:MAG: histidine phosphatase family protein [Thermomicrobiales bacterium]|nr:histidine phosphatase family protein [Thermomicrobiales bacterium]